MNKVIQIAPVRKSITVAVSPQRAFEVFTAGIDKWWPKTHGIGNGPVKTSVIEPFVGGRWYGLYNDDSEVTNGHVLVWEPGVRLVTSWEISAQWKSDPRAEFASEVEVRFIAESDTHTRVEIEHRNFERMGLENGQVMHDAVDGGWTGILQLFDAALAQ
jgi:uncharacterized protein YndB with AHSA1/START domain